MTDTEFYTSSHKNIRFLPPAASLDEIRELRSQDGGAIWLAGDMGMIRWCDENGLLDEVVRLAVPVNLGNGIPYKLDTESHGQWTQVSESYPDGVLKLTYRKIIN